ncbi:hypothetical protein E4L96_02160 [Massilia arenosa]|uniref:Uncharacterized protein n=1 Tax=Zemynaea arenosa TaxID=2561931 RepID=A0A4Y9STA7_9BURK|nr:hypothetical protein [Massilia arenosa]TFW28727.1 hypothetical protein E4L96_02160 [Massilia arenosa]
MPTLKSIAVLVTGAFAAASTLAAEPVQKVKPPVSQAYIDLATFSGGMPAMGGGGGMFGGLFGGGGAKTGGNTFGQTQGASTGRWMDVTLMTRNNPKMMHATQSVPTGSKLSPNVKLEAPELEKPSGGGAVSYQGSGGDMQMPKGKMYLYWGCGTEVRKGQPLVLDMAKMDPAQMSKFFQNRGQTFQVPPPQPGRPVWPNKNDDRLLPEGASMAGEHSFAGEGVVEGFRFNIDKAHDLMPAIVAKRADAATSVNFSWQPIEQAKAWFVASMGMRNAEKDEMEMVYWTSSELPDMGMGLLNYQPDGAVDKWLKEKVLLPGKATECAAPKEAISATAMTRIIAYGDELNMAYPPRPKDPKITWEPQWDVKVRTKSVASLMPGMGDMAAAMAAAQQGEGAERGQNGQPPAEQKPQSATDSLIKAATPSAFDVLRGLIRK